ncbi:MAG: glycosyltransferase, exosortase A system-associated [Sphingopyxis sp.]|nr:glycosyltransferase, exosortase A system-associated [Sphingopyxis sp.]
MTRILHVLDHSLPAHSGYTFRTRALMKAQVAKGWQVAGVTGVRHPEPGPDGETVDGLTFYRTPPIAPAPPAIREWREIGALAKRVEALVKEWKPDLLHAHSPVMDGLAALSVGKKLGVPVIYEIRAFWEDAAVGNGTGREGSLRYWLTKRLETHAVRSADAVAVICEGLRGDLIARGIDPAKITVSPNGVDLDLFGTPTPRDDALAETLGMSADDAVIGYIGSFYDYEGIDDLIAAMPALVAAQPSAKLLLVGGGPTEAALKPHAAGSPAAAHIHFVGRVPHQEVERYYSLIDILAYPRKKMRLTDLVTPLKPLEAMAQGKLVAASDVGGHRELIEHGVTGTLFAPDDAPAIADALAFLLDNRDLWPERRQTARIFVESHRNWSSNILRYEPVYQQLLRSGV